MFLIFPKDEYYQWDTGQIAQLKTFDADISDITEVHMWNDRIGRCAMVQPIHTGENGRYVEIPDELFQRAGRIIFWAVISDVNGACTVKDYDGINVISRAKPTDYMPGKVETLYYKELLERIDGMAEDWDKLMSEEVPRVEQAVKDAEEAEKKAAAAENAAVGAEIAAAKAVSDANQAIQNTNQAIKNANDAASAASTAAGGANAIVEDIKQKLEVGEFTGAPGESAYEIALKSGFEGTEAQWLASLKSRGAVDYLPGDVDGNGVVDNIDAMLVSQYLAGEDVEIYLPAADVDGDGEITEVDAELILAYYVAGGEGVELKHSPLAGVAYAKVEQTENGAEITLTDMNGTTTAKLTNGKSAYAYACEGGYEGSEAEFATNLANAVKVTVYTGEVEVV